MDLVEHAKNCIQLAEQNKSKLPKEILDYKRNSRL